MTQFHFVSLVQSSADHRYTVDPVAAYSTASSMALSLLQIEMRRLTAVKAAMQSAGKNKARVSSSFYSYCSSRRIPWTMELLTQASGTGPLLSRPEEQNGSISPLTIKRKLWWGGKEALRHINKQHH